MTINGRAQYLPDDAGGARARVFFALWPDEAVRASLARCARDAQAECGGRAIRAEKIHLTLFFIGAIARERLAALETLALAVRAASFELQVNVLGYWRHNQIVWAGARECPAALTSLVTVLSAGLAGEGIRSEERPYVPHITLVRGATLARATRTAAPLTWRARDFVLVESVAARGGVSYEVRGRWPLCPL